MNDRRAWNGKGAAVWATVAACFASFAAVLCVAAPASAEQTEKRVFRVEMAGPAKDLALLDAVLRDVFSGLHVDPQIAVVARIDARDSILGSSAAPPPSLLGRAFLDLSDPARATVYLVDAKWERILVRHVPHAADPEVLNETVGRIVSTGVEALLGGSFGDVSHPVEHKSPPPQAPPPGPSAQPFETEPTPRASLTSRVGVMYEASLYSRAAPLTHGPGLVGHVELGRARLRPLLYVTAQYRFPIIDSDPPVGLRLDTTAFRIGVGFAFDITSTFAFEAALGPGLDLMHLAPRLDTSSDLAVTTSERWFVLGLARAVAGVRWHVTRSFSVQSALVADIDLSGSRFTFDDSTGRVPVIAPYPIRPGLALGLSLP